jgi:hypothetical protein
MRAFVFLLGAVVLGGCDKPRHDTTTVEIVQVERFGQTGDAVTQMDIELTYSECPGDSRRVVRADKAFAHCASGLKAGDKVKAEVVSKYSSERGVYRSEIVKLAECPMKLDPKEEANYEIVQQCSDVTTTGNIVGVHCDRARGEKLVEKCPWLRRR